MTQQQIEEIKKEFFDEFVQDNGENIEPSFGDPNGSVGPVWQFIEQKLREVEEKVLRDFINYLSEDIGRTADRDEAMEQNAKLYSYYEEQLCEYLKNKLEGKLTETPKYEWECELFGCEECIVISREKGKQPNWFWRFMQYLILGNKWKRINSMKYVFIGQPDNRFSDLITGSIYDLVVEVIDNKPVIVKPFRCPYSSWRAFFKNWELVSSN